MKRQVIQMHKEMERQLTDILKEPESLSRYSQSYRAVQSKVIILKGFIDSYVFKSMAEEVYFFKMLAPLFYCKFYYFFKVINLEIAKRETSIEYQRRHIEQELKGIDLFYTFYKDFFTDYYLNNSGWDEDQFIRSEETMMELPSEDFALIMDRNFSIGTFKVAKLMANQHYRPYLVGELGKLNNQKDREGIENITLQITWNRSIADAIEIIYGLAKTKALSIEGRLADIKQIVKFWESTFNMKMGNVYDRNRINNGRKKDKNPFLNSMKDDMPEKND
jgi:hypothetical protein